MTRTLIASLAIAALAVPATATALNTATDASSTKAATGFTVGFKVDKVSGEPTNVRNFKFKRLRMDCDQGRVLLSAKNIPDMPVAADHFEDEFTEGGGTIAIDGDFNAKATKVEGSVGADGTFPNSNGGGNFTGCNGDKNYTAK